MQNELSKMVSEIEEMIDPDVMSEEELQGIVGKEISNFYFFSHRTAPKFLALRSLRLLFEPLPSP